MRLFDPVLDRGLRAALSDELLLRAERVLEKKKEAKVTPKSVAEARFETFVKGLESQVALGGLARLPLLDGLQQLEFNEAFGGECVDPVLPIGGTVLRRCRKCAACRSVAVRPLLYKMALEVAAAPRTWNCTLTFAVEDEGYGEFQLFMKRLRKRTPRLRYYAVSERGSKRGRYHYHALIFCQPSLGKRDVSASWTCGLSYAKLVDTRFPFAYLAKYVTKDMVKLRASNYFGHSSPELLAFEQITQAPW